MTRPPRDETIKRLASPLGDPAKAKRKPGAKSDLDQLGWDEIGFFWEGISFAQRPLRAATEKVIKAYDLGPRGAWILNLVDNGLVYPMELSSLFSIGRSLITVELARLTEAGLISSEPGEEDRRRTRLVLTPAGKAACQEIRDEMAATLRRQLAAYSVEDIRLISRMLYDLRQGYSWAG